MKITRSLKKSLINTDFKNNDQQGSLLRDFSRYFMVLFQERNIAHLFPKIIWPLNSFLWTHDVL